MGHGEQLRHARAMIPRVVYLSSFRGYRAGVPNYATRTLAAATAFGQRLARMRELCRDLDRAVATADAPHPKLIVQLKGEADDAYHALTAEGLAIVPFLLPSPSRQTP
jgi:hypothetical protein